jgi:WD40 repeat protein/serine/threonine protein kinase
MPQEFGTANYGRFDELAEEFAERYRRGEQPGVEEYVERLPEMADEIREMFPALAEVEQVQGDAREGLKQPPSVPTLRALGDYRIVREIGRGGMGVVYEAAQISLGRRVALKVLPHQVAQDARALERFRREAKAAARLHHTNIVPVFEVGQEGEVAFYAMQFIQGQGLDQVIDELRRLRTPEHEPVGNNQGHAGSGGAVSDASDIEAASVAAANPLGPNLGPVAESLLTGRFETGGMVASAGNGFETSEGAGAWTEPLDPAAPTEAESPKTGRHLLEIPPAADVSSSALLPGGTAVSAVESSGRRLPLLRSVARIGCQAAQGLAYAHSRGIVHRDIKPSNLLLDTAGVVWITDFGLAKAGDDDLTATGDIIGTLRYMAPERFRGEGDARADVYALGLTLYELMTLRPAFETSDRLKLIERIKSEEPLRPRALDGRIPRDLETIVLKAIAKDPKDRYSAADALAEDLRRFLDDEPILARRTSKAERFARWARRNKGLAASLLAIAVLTVAVAIGSTLAAFYFQQQEQTQKQLATRNRTLADASEAASRLAEQRADEIQQNLYCAEMNLAGQAAESAGGIGRVSELLGHWRPTTAERDRRGWEWYYLRTVGQRALLSWPHRHGLVGALSWNPDGRRLASSGNDGAIRIWDGITGKLLATLLGHGPIVRALSWDPRGRRLASAGNDRTVKIWDPDTGHQIMTLCGHTDFVRTVSWSPVGSRVASGGGDGIIKIWDPDARRAIATIRAHAGEVHPVCWSPDGQRLASGGHDGAIKIWDPALGQETVTIRAHGDQLHAVSWSPDGRRLAGGGASGMVTLWDPKTGRETASLRGHANHVRQLAWSPDSRHLASASYDQTIKIWDPDRQRVVATLRGHTGIAETVAWSPDGRRLASGGSDPWLMVWEPDLGQGPSFLRGHTDTAWCLTWSPDGRRLASGGLDHTVRIWDAARGQETATLRGHRDAVYAVSWSPDGRRLASGGGGSDGTVKIWDPDTGQETATLRGHHDQITAVSWSPDGRRLASGSYEGSVKLWEAGTDRELATLPINSQILWAVSWSPDSRLVACAAITGAIKVWDADRLREIASFPGHSSEAKAICWSPDGQRLASGGMDSRVRVWHLATRRETVTISGHTDWVSGVSWSPDGHRLASASNDGSVKIWDPDTGQETATLRGHSDRVNAVSWSRDGQRLASASWDRTIRIWDASPGYIDERSPVLLPGVDRRLAVQPPSAPDLQVRAEIRARLGQWDRAAADWTQSARLQKRQQPRWFQAGWWVLGPISRTAVDAAEPEADIDPFRSIFVANPSGLNSAPLHWRAASGSAKSCLDLGALFPNARSGSARALVRVYAPRQEAATARLGSTSSYRFWLNGRLAHERSQAGRPDGDDERVLLALRAGWNTLLFQVEVGNEADWLSLALE